jgi:hypothetical protein
LTNLFPFGSYQQSSELMSTVQHKTSETPKPRATAASATPSKTGQGARPATTGVAPNRAPSTAARSGAAASAENASDSTKRKVTEPESQKHDEEFTTDGAAAATKRAKFVAGSTASSSSSAAAAASTSPVGEVADDKSNGASDSTQLVSVGVDQTALASVSRQNASPWVDLNIRFTNSDSKEKLYWLRYRVPVLGASEPMDIAFKKIAAPKADACARMLLIDARSENEFMHTTPFMLLGSATRAYPFGNVDHVSADPNKKKPANDTKTYEAPPISSGQLSFQFTVMPYDKHNINAKTGVDATAEKYREWTNRVFEQWLWASARAEGTRVYSLWRTYCSTARVDTKNEAACRDAFPGFVALQASLFKKTVEENGIKKNSNDGKAMYVTDYMTTMRRDEAAVPEPKSTVWYVQQFSKEMIRFETAHRGHYFKKMSLVDAEMKDIPYFQRFKYENGDMCTTIGAGCVVSARIKLMPDGNVKTSLNPCSLKPQWIHGILARQGVQNVVEEETAPIVGGEPFRFETSVSSTVADAGSTALVPVEYKSPFGDDAFAKKKKA